VGAAARTIAPGTTEARGGIPSGEKTILRVPNYGFDWRSGTRTAEPLDLPKGARFKTVAHYDNSPANKFNPDPTVNVRYEHRLDDA
jgi:hypothetical protein